MIERPIPTLEAMMADPIYVFRFTLNGTAYDAAFPARDIESAEREIDAWVTSEPAFRDGDAVPVEIYRSTPERP